MLVSLIGIVKFVNSTCKCRVVMWLDIHRWGSKIIPEVLGAGKEVQISQITFSQQSGHALLSGQITLPWEFGSSSCFVQLVADKKGTSMEGGQKRCLRTDTWDITSLWHITKSPCLSRVLWPFYLKPIPDWLILFRFWQSWKFGNLEECKSCSAYCTFRQLCRTQMMEISCLYRQCHCYCTLSCNNCIIISHSVTRDMYI